MKQKLPSPLRGMKPPGIRTIWPTSSERSKTTEKLETAEEFNLKN